ncbi:MAG: hypothetical protein GX187_03725 [Clostridiaceae bacterium]|mgnify:CR=1 FL=1|nr:hypothetical protein [Clostridiaceae bacterium]
MNNILQDIIKCEREATRLEEEARQKSLKIISEARKKAAELVETSLIEGEALSEKLIKEAQEKAEQKLSLVAHQEIKTVSAEKIEAAVNLIVERVVDKPWQW